MTSPVKPTTDAPPSQPLTFWQGFHRRNPYLRHSLDFDFPDYDDDIPTVSTAEQVREVASAAAESVFGVHVTQYSPDDFVTRSPGALAMRWRGAPNVTAAVKTTSPDGVRLMEVAKELARQGESAQGNGEVHMLATDDKEHAYTIVTPWYKTPASVAPWLGKPGNNNVFRMLVACFAAGGGELPPRANPPLTGIEPVDAGDGTEIERYRAEQWQHNRPFGGLVPLGLSSMIWSRHYQEIYDESTGLLVRSSPFATSRYHALDGYLTWLLIVDTRTNRTMYAAVGAGTHPLRYIDQINPIMGGVVMSVMMRTFVHVLRGGQEGPNPMLDDRPTFRTLNGFIDRVDPALALQRRLLELVDRMGIPASEARRSHGGTVTDE